MKTLNYSTPSDIRAALVRSVSELINVNGQAFYDWQSSKLGNDLFINDPDRASRIYDAAEDGCDGSTHAEHIEDFTEYADEHYTELERAAEYLDESVCSNLELTVLLGEIEVAREALTADLERLEKWHADNGSLHEQVG